MTVGIEDTYPPNLKEGDVFCFLSTSEWFADTNGLFMLISKKEMATELIKLRCLCLLTGGIVIPIANVRLNRVQVVA